MILISGYFEGWKIFVKKKTTKKNPKQTLTFAGRYYCDNIKCLNSDIRVDRKDTGLHVPFLAWNIYKCKYFS